MSNPTETAYLALGSNLGDRAGYLQAAIDRLGATPEVAVAAVSSFHRTIPVGGPPGQDDYVNAAARIETSLSPQALLARCLEIEQDQGRMRAERWGPRTLDIDILLHGARIVRTEGLIVPHPRLRERRFVLVPLAEVAPPGLRLPPDGALLETLLADAPTQEEPALSRR